MLDAIGLGETSGLVFVAEEIVSMLQGIENLSAFELNQEGSREVQAHGLVCLGSILANFSQSIVVGSDEEARGVKNFCLLDEGKVCLQVLCGELQASSKVGDKAALLVVDNDCAGASWRVLIVCEDTMDSFLSKFNMREILPS